MNSDVYVCPPFVTRDLLIYILCHIKQIAVYNYDLRGTIAVHLSSGNRLTRCPHSLQGGSLRPCSCQANLHTTRRSDEITQKNEDKIEDRSRGGKMGGGGKEGEEGESKTKSGEEKIRRVSERRLNGDRKLIKKENITHTSSLPYRWPLLLARLGFSRHACIHRGGGVMQFLSRRGTSGEAERP